MPFYSRLRYEIRDKAERARVIGNLQALAAHLDKKVPAKDADANLLLATWNIRDFGKTNRRGYGKRHPEAFFYIAEILSRFDFVAVQEVNELDDLEAVMRILGPDWDFIASDVTDTALGGNGERLTYLFDKRKMLFQNIAGEIVLPASMLISQAIVDQPDGTRINAGKQFRRSPFVARFQSGWFKFDVCTVHLYYGAESGPQLQERIEEIDRIARYFGGRAEAAAKDGRALILLGDFNIMHPEHETMKALTDAGFRVPSQLANPTNYKHTMYYDQIALAAADKVLARLEANDGEAPAATKAGVLDIFAPIYKPGQWRDYVGQMQASSNGKKKTTDAALKKYYDDWLTYQLSDHRPLWVRIASNDSAAYLEALKAEATG